jgi:tRNA pseudouridine38-40 synthase
MTSNMILKLTIAYDGRPFCGWQSQASGGAVQDHLEAAFAKIVGRRVVVQGSGRTDAGVHALGQIAHAEVDNTRASREWLAALNANLPREIRVLRCVRATPGFHARFDAIGKIYRYRVANTPFLHPLELGRAWHVPHTLDLPLLEKCLRKITGKHDFAAFAASRGKPEKSTIRTIHSARLTRSAGGILTLTFEGDGFLYRMVRLLTGTLIRVAQHRADPKWIDDLLSAKHGKTSFAAPADGLYLAKVIYSK